MDLDRRGGRWTAPARGGDSFPCASNRWATTFLVHTRVQPEGTVNTWSHRDEDGKKSGVYRDDDLIGRTNVNPNSLETPDKRGRLWKVEVAGKQAPLTPP